MQIRVHGIGGPPAERVLGHPPGTGTDGIWRIDAFGRSSLRVAGDPGIAVYHWAPLTSGSRWFALWPLLLPFTVLNVAGWMHAPGARAPVARGLAALLAVSLTAAFTAWALLAGQILVDGSDDWRPQVLGTVGTVVAVLVVLAVSQWTRRGFERVEPPDHGITTSDQWPGLADRRFFAQVSRQQHAVIIHAAAVAATLAWVIWASGKGSATVGSAAASAVTALGGLQVPLLILFAGATVRRAGWWSLAAFSTAAFGIGLVGGLVTAGLQSIVGTCQLAERTATDDEVPRACAAISGDPFALFDVYGMAALVGLGTAVAIIVRALLRAAPGEAAAVDADLLPTVSARLRARLAVVPSQLIGALVVAAVTFVAGAAVLFPARAPATVQRWCADVPTIDAGDWPCSALREPAGDEPWQLTSSPTVEVGQLTLYALLSFVLLNLLKSLKWSRGSLASHSASVSAAAMRRVGSLWDVLTFWPRLFHPFAVRPYAERAVPELAHLLVGGPLPAVTVDLRAHSQGSVLVLAALAPYPSREAVSVLSFGSPLVALYARAFPAYVNRNVIDGVTSRWRWRNAFRFTDHVGRVLFVDDDAVWGPDGRDLALADPASPHARVEGHNDYWTDKRLEVGA